VKNPPEYKRYRLGVAVAYFAVTGFAGACLLVSSFQGARARMGIVPEMPPAASVGQAQLVSCFEQLEGLRAELKMQMDATLASSPARLSSSGWDDWSPGWRQRLLNAGAQCRLSVGDVPGSAELKQVYEGLSELHRHYTTLAVQFSKEIGPHSDRLSQAVDRARETLPKTP